MFEVKIITTGSDALRTLQGRQLGKTKFTGNANLYRILPVLPGSSSPAARAARASQTKDLRCVAAAHGVLRLADDDCVY